jgi:hypothetical protein
MTTSVFKLSESRILKFEMDSLTSEIEPGINKFIMQCFLIEKITTWSALLKLDEVDELLASNKPENSNIVHSQV